VVAGLSLLAGVLLGLAAASDVDPWWAWCALASAGLVVVIHIHVTTARRSWPLFAGVMLAFGLALATLAVGRWQKLQWLPDEGRGESRLLLEGVVRGVPGRDGAELRFDADAGIVAGGLVAKQDLRRVRLHWRDAPVAPRAGERWRWLVRVSHASHPLNFAGVDMARVAMRDRIHLDAQVMTATLTSRQELAPASIDTLRARVALRVADHVADPEAAALITALAVGVTAGMSADQWRVFNATGTTHLVAISGMHVTLFATLMFFVSRRLWRRLPVAPRITREPFALLMGLVSAGGYSLLAGFSVPTQRTLLMLTLFALTRVSARHVGAGQIWSLALVGVLLFDVFAPLDAGFWLSFIAVGVILLHATSGIRAASAVYQWLGLQWAVTLALVPLTFLVFGGVSLVGLAVNLVAIPVISFVLVPLVLAGAVCALAWPLACGTLFSWAATLHDWLWPALVWAADLDFAAWRRQPSVAWLALALPASLLLLLRWPWALRLGGLAMVLPLAFSPATLAPSGEVRMRVLDAGRGSAVLLRTRNYALLFDTGDAWNTRGSRAARVVLPAMDAWGLGRIDRLVLPQLDEDRAQGVALLAHGREVAEVLVGGHWQGTTLPVRACRDESWTRDGVRFESFATGRHDCALRVSVNRRSIFLAGDLDSGSEHRLLARWPSNALASDVVLISRGGSSRGSSRQWIENSRAKLAIAAGGHAGAASRARTLERWRDADIPVLDVHHEGDVEISLGMQGFAVLGTARSARYPFAWRRRE